MLPKPIPKQFIDNQLGIACKFTAPDGREDEIGDLEVLILEDTKAVLQGRQPDAARFVSWWQPDDKELEQLKLGAPVRLEIVGATQINPMSIEVGTGFNQFYVTDL